MVEEVALGWLESIAWLVRNGSEIAPGEPAAERDDYGQVVLAQRLRDALARLNPQLPAEALEDAFRKLTRPEGAELVARNRAVHRLLVDGVTVEYRTAGERQGPVHAGRARPVRGLRAGGTARRGAAHPRRRGLSPGRAGGAR